MAAYASPQLSLACRLLRSPLGGHGELYIMGDISAEGTQAREAGGHVVLVLDVSESMYVRPFKSPADEAEFRARYPHLAAEGRTSMDSEGAVGYTGQSAESALPYTDPPAIERAAGGVREACASLPDSERVEIILFSERADVVFSGSPGDPKLGEVLGAVTRRRSVKALGEGTVFGAGLSSALRRLGGIAPERHPRLVLVSDGQAQDANQALAVARNVGAQGFSLVCLGVGDTDSAMLMGEMVSVVGGGHYRHVHGGEALAAALSTQFVSRQDVAFDRVELIVHYTHEVGMDSLYRLDCAQAGGIAVVPCVADEAEPSFARYRLGPVGGPVAHRFVVPVIPFAPGGGRVPIMALGYVGSERESKDAVRTEVPVEANSAAEPGPTDRRLIAWTVAHNCQARGKRAALDGEWSAAQEAYADAARTYRTLGAESLAAEAGRQADEAKNQSWNPVRADTVSRETLWVDLPGTAKPDGR